MRFMIVTLVLALPPVLASAHHSAVRFDLSQIVVIDGTVVEYELRSPHSYVTVEDNAGRIWQLETDATPILTRSGWTHDSFEPGDPVHGALGRLPRFPPT